MTITGQVTDVNTGGGLPGATLSVNGAAVGQTDSSGNFSINVSSSSDTITASYVGYNSLSQAAALIQESGLIQLSVNPDTLQAAVVTPAKKTTSSLLLLGGLGVLVLASTDKRHSSKVSGKGSNLIPIVAVGLGAYAVYAITKKPAVATSTSTTNAPYAPVTGSGTTSLLSSTSSWSSIFSGLSNLFGGSSSTPGFVPVGVQQTPGVSSNPSTYSPASGISTINPTAPTIPITGSQDTSADDLSSELGFVAGLKVKRDGMGDAATSTFSADQVVDKTLYAAQQVPVYNTPTDTATPVGYIAAGNPVGVVYSWLDVDPTAARGEVWWMFQAPAGSSLGDSNGFYFAPQKAGYYSVDQLVAEGALTVQQQQAIESGQQPSTAQTLLDRYLPWVIGAVVGYGLLKTVINKAI